MSVCDSQRQMKGLWSKVNPAGWQWSRLCRRTSASSPRGYPRTPEFERKRSPWRGLAQATANSTITAARATRGLDGASGHFGQMNNGQTCRAWLSMALWSLTSPSLSASVHGHVLPSRQIHSFRRKNGDILHSHAASSAVKLIIFIAVRHSGWMELMIMSWCRLSLSYFKSCNYRTPVEDVLTSIQVLLCYFTLNYMTTFRKPTLYFFLHYISLTTLVTLQV